MQNIKRLFNKQKTKILPTLDFLRRCINDVVDMRENPNAFDVVKLGFSLKDNYEVAFNLNDPYTYFNNSNEWQFIFEGVLADLFYEILNKDTKTHTSIILTNPGGYTAFLVQNGEIGFGVLFFDEHVEKMFIRKEHLKEYLSVLRSIFWGLHGQGRVLLSATEENEVRLTEDEKNETPIISSRAELEAKEIQKFLDKDISRSIIYYGPPGAGKSSLVKSIVNHLNFKSLRIKNLSNIDSEIMLLIIEILLPDILILEDIDNISASEISDLLEKMERLNKHTKVILATANEITDLSEALVRPGRFDKAKEVSQLESAIILQLIENDESLLELVEYWPAAYIVELMKRIKALGREVALEPENYQDLADRVENLGYFNYKLKIGEPDHGDTI